MNNKIEVSRVAIGLWFQVLSGPVAVPEWEVEKCSDIRELLKKGLVKITGSGYPMKYLELVDLTNGLPSDAPARKMLALIQAYDEVAVNDLIAAAKNDGITSPLAEIKKLFELDLVEFTDENKKAIWTRVKLR